MRLRRLIPIIVFIQVVGLLAAARSSYAATSELMVGIGADMMKFAGARYQDRPRTVFLNGLTLRFSSGSAKANLSEVLAYFHAGCREHNGRLFEQYVDFEKDHRVNKSWENRPFIDGILSYHDENRGYVACIDTGNRKLSPREVIRRVKSFFKTGELSEIGEFRYVMAERVARGTSFMTLWTDGPANLFRAFPQGVDAPGRDIEIIPRPPESRRLLSAWESDQAPAIFTYVTELLSAAQVNGFYRENLVQSGWEVLKSRSNSSTREGSVLLAVRDGQTVSIDIREGDTQRTVTILKMN